MGGVAATFTLPATDDRIAPVLAGALLENSGAWALLSTTDRDAHDAMGLLADATRRAGPNRARIRDALAEVAPWSGVTGPLTWDLTGRNQGPVILGVWRGGRAVKR